MNLPESEILARDALLARFPDSAELLPRYVQILATKGIQWGLLGPREGDKLWSRHIANSLALVDVVANGLDVADVGSGAGLPGIPLAIARPDLQLTLLEPLLRRATFLTETVDELGLADRVQVVRGRAEETKQHFDVVIARAVAGLDTLLGWTSGLFLPDGELLALKGSSAATEIEAASKRLQKLRLTARLLHPRAATDVEGTTVVKVTRIN